MCYNSYPFVETWRVNTTVVYLEKLNHKEYRRHVDGGASEIGAWSRTGV